MLRGICGCGCALILLLGVAGLCLAVVTLALIVT